ncbi:hypothetical protein [Rhodocyclus tenuis]|uniref:hypothetical protein n=1 Tax=Rhodocyclus tenuis TaxID=1066 RepID=UPI001904DFD4|nr:hypothetical protein [Rhodocyclus tenuis]
MADANFAQMSINMTEKFSPEGAAQYGRLAGYPIGTVDDLAAALLNGSIKPSQIPVDYVVTDNGTKLILNTRTSVALDRAGVAKAEWYGSNKTNVPVPNPSNDPALIGKTFDDLAADQLRKNGLSSTGYSEMPKPTRKK